jgi:hypothetical protein
MNVKAFPSAYDAQTRGMDLRDYFAIHADVPWNAVIETLSIRGVSIPTVQQLAEQRAAMKYVEADAMLAARKKES